MVKTQTQDKLGYSNRHISFQNLLPGDGNPHNHAADGPRDGGGPRSRRRLVQRSGTQSRHHAIDDIIRIPNSNHTALQPRVHQPNNAAAVPDLPARLTRPVEDPVYFQLQGVGGLDRLNAGAETLGGAGCRAGEIANPRIVGQILTPRSSLRDGLLLEEELR